ncbi:SAM-dependent methyltransferase, partial [Pseudomonas syringae]
GMQRSHGDALRVARARGDGKSGADLLGRTPHGERASAERRAAVSGQPGPFTVTVSMRYDYVVLQ